MTDFPDFQSPRGVFQLRENMATCTECQAAGRADGAQLLHLAAVGVGEMFIGIEPQDSAFTAFLTHDRSTTQKKTKIEFRGKSRAGAGRSSRRSHRDRPPPWSGRAVSGQVAIVKTSEWQPRKGTDSVR